MYYLKCFIEKNGGKSCKILNTQLTGIFNRLEKQALDIQMAAQCLIQALAVRVMFMLKDMKI